MSFFALLVAFLSFVFVQALPASVDSRQSIVVLPQGLVDNFDTFTFFAAAAYCEPNTTDPWTCGTKCDGNPNFVPTASGGDGSDIQFRALSQSFLHTNRRALSRGTDPKKILADLRDLDILLENLNSSLFPGLSTSIEVHSGFADEHALTALTILSNVQSTLAANPNANTVITVGHSLGAALALLEGVFLPLHLPSNITVETVVYGLPRVGNQAFADHVDAHLSMSHINNKEDPIPILPGEFLGFVHPSGELHIMDNNQWVSCPGQDNPSTECIVGDVPNIFESVLTDHHGPYNGIDMGC